MKKYKLLSSLIFTAMLTMCMSLTAFANSSWAWISETRPYDILPFAALGTLIIETAAINFFTKRDSWHKTFTGVFIGNALSFALPYVFYNFFTTPYSGYYTLGDILERGPFYTVGTVFLIMTLAVEVPFMYLWLRKDTQNKTVLILSALIINGITTGLVALTERLLCQGQW